MKKTWMIYSVLCTSLLCSAPVFASCARADLTGIWRTYSMFDSVGRCTIVMGASGSAIASNSSCYLPGVADSAPVTGSLSITTGCRVTGSISLAGEPRTIDAWIGRGKDSISGMGWHPTNSMVGFIFSGVRQ
jgi:hypothetical protein